MFRFTNHEWTGDILDHLMAKKAYFKFGQGEP
jgi:hypothetical protein